MVSATASTTIEKDIREPTADPERGPRETDSEPYSAFTKREKWFIVTMVSYALLSSNLCSFIYFPALKFLSERFSVSVGQINLMITSYMAVATVAPTLVGDLADILGRRLAYLVTLSLFVTSNICLALAKSYSQLLGLRVLQALGVSGR